MRPHPFGKAVPGALSQAHCRRRTVAGALSQALGGCSCHSPSVRMNGHSLSGVLPGDFREHFAPFCSKASLPGPTRRAGADQGRPCTEASGKGLAKHSVEAAGRCVTPAVCAKWVTLGPRGSGTTPSTETLADITALTNRINQDGYVHLWAGEGGCANQEDVQEDEAGGRVGLDRAHRGRRN